MNPLLSTILRPWATVRTKLAAAITLFIGLIALFIYVYLPRTLEQQALEAVASKAQSVAEMTAFSAGFGLFFDDAAAVEDAFRIAQQNPDLVYLVATDSAGTVAASYGGEAAALAVYREASVSTRSGLYGSVYKTVVPISVEGTPIGRLYLGLSLDEVQADVARSSTLIGWVSLLLFLVGVGLVFAISTALTRPLSQIARTAELIAAGDLSHRAEIHTQDEVGHLARSFNRMVQHLETAHRDMAALNTRLARQKEAIERAHDELDARVRARTADLTRANEELVRAKELAEAGTRAKSEFLASMSHEIRTPLNGIVGMTDVLVESGLGAEHRGYVEVIHSSGNALLGLINDILDFSKIEAGQLELEHRPFDVRACAEEALDIVAIRAAEKELELACVVDPAVPAAVLGDANRLRQILVNLLGNAIKFTEEGEVVLGLAVDPDASDPAAGEACTLHFSVRDTGIGIPEARRDRLFKSFSQIDASTTRRYGGTGLGLAISKQLSELMGGTIHVESQEGAGSTFYVTVRLEGAPEQEGAALQRPQPMLQGRTVLIVDDHAASRDMLAGPARTWGMTPVLAASGEEALALLDGPSSSFDVALVDQRMLGMDGIELARALAERAPGTPILLCSPIGDSTYGAEGLLAATLTKPIKRTSLRQALLRTLGRHSTDAEAQAALAAPEAARDPAALRVLLAEDNPVNQKVAVLVLNRLGYTADVASNGVEVLEALRHAPYDVVLMDVRMPEMDGIEATRRIIAEWPVDERPAIIAMTADVTEEKRAECLAAGMTDFLTKPIDKHRLARTLEQYCDAGQAPHPGAAREPETVPAPAALAETVIDLTGLKEEFGDDRAFLCDLLETFLRDAPDLVAGMQDALKTNDATALARMAHSLKSTSALVGADHLTTLSKALEAASHEDAHPQLAARVAQLTKAFDAVREAVEEHVRQLRAA